MRFDCSRARQVTKELRASIHLGAARLAAEEPRTGLRAPPCGCTNAEVRVAPIPLYSNEAVTRIIEAAGGFPPPTENYPRSPDERERDLAERLEFDGERLLTAWLARSEKRGASAGRPRPRPLGVALAEFVEALLWVWLDLFFEEKRPRRGRGRFRVSVRVEEAQTRADGPLVRFLRACVSELRAGLLAHPVEYRGQRVDVHSLTDRLGRLTAAALRRRVQRSDARKTVRRLATLRRRVTPGH